MPIGIVESAMALSALISAGAQGYSSYKQAEALNEQVQAQEEKLDQTKEIFQKRKKKMNKQTEYIEKQLEKQEEDTEGGEGRTDAQRRRAQLKNQGRQGTILAGPQEETDSTQQKTLLGGTV